MAKKSSKKPIRKVPKGASAAKPESAESAAAPARPGTQKPRAAGTHSSTASKPAEAAHSHEPFGVERAAIAALVIKPGAQSSAPRRPRLPNGWHLLRASISLLLHNKKLFFGITAVYATLLILFVQSTNVDVGSTKASLDQLFSGHGAKLTSATSLFSYMLSSSGASSPDGAVYQFFFVLLTSLAIILALRYAHARQFLRVRDAFYNGLYPFAQFVLVLTAVALQFIPLVIGTTLYGAVVSNGVAVTAFENVLWLLMFMGTILLSMRFVSSSFLALYLVTVPGMTPKAALQTAKRLVRGRRWQVIRKMLFLPVALLLLAGIIMLPVILAVPGTASIVFFVLMLFGLSLFHSYMYALYRGLMA